MHTARANGAGSGASTWGPTDTRWTPGKDSHFVENP